MKGYFSELARHTGLRFGSGRTPAASPAASTQPNSEVKGLVVEEVTFTTPSQPSDVGVETTATEAAVNISDRSDARRPERANIDRELQSKSEVRRIHKPSDPTIEVTTVNLTHSDSITKRNLPSTEIETHVFDDPRVVIPAPASVDEQTSAAGQVAESVSSLESRNAPSAPDLYSGAARREVTADEPGRYSRATEQSETGLDDGVERVERQLIVRNYLKEISEWISTPTTEEESVSFISEDSGTSTGDRARRAERMNSLAPDGAAAPEQQDLTLSIGTIRIVVEEPRAQAPVSTPPPAPPANTERTFARTTTAPTDLSRYYINRW